MKQLALFGLGLGLLALAPVAKAQIINDTFSTNPANPNDVGWYSSAGTVTTFNGSSGALQFTQGDTTANVSVFKQFSQTTLAVGESLRLTFDYTAFASQPISVSNSHFRIGLFDTSNTFTSNQAASSWSTTNEGYTMGIGAGTTGATSNFFYRTGNAGIVSTTSPSTALGAADTLNVTNFALVPVNVEFTITRLSATEIQLAGKFVQNSITTTFTTKNVTATGNYVDTFDTLFIGYGSSANGRGFTIDNVNLTVVPEPSSYALLLGGLGLLVLLRRRRFN